MNTLEIVFGSSVCLQFFSCRLFFAFGFSHPAYALCKLDARNFLSVRIRSIQSLFCEDASMIVNVNERMESYMCKWHLGEAVRQHMHTYTHTRCVL